MIFDFRKIENLSKILIERKKETKIRQDIEKILHFAQKIKYFKSADKINITGLVDLVDSRIRQDILCDSKYYSDVVIVKNIPNKEEKYYKVPRILKAK